MRFFPTRVLFRTSYSSTLNLPKSGFPPRPLQTAVPHYLRRCTDELYQWQKSRGSINLESPTSALHVDVWPTFVLHDGPPYANGSLHIGHALNKILKDIICRFQVTQGSKVEYVPGWDCHGLPIEIKALQQLDATSHEHMTAAEVRQAARNLAEKTVEEQKNGFKEWAVMGDWDSAYRTMDREFEMRQLGVFKEMVVKGLIYRQFKPVYWSPSSGTALAEAELEYDENHRSTAAFIKFPVVKLSSALCNIPGVNPNNLAAVIWTTTPWTLPANRAIAVHKDLEYSVLELPGRPNAGQLLVAKSQLEYLRPFLAPVDGEIKVVADSIPGSDLTGSHYINILHGQDAVPQPVIHADFVSSGSGSGLVHLAPGHGMDDYNVCAQHGIAAFAPVDDHGCFTKQALPDQPELFQGLDVQKEGTRAVLEYLRRDRSHPNYNLKELVLTAHQITHKYPIDWRTKLPVITRATEQWFADVEDLKAGALQALEKVAFIPETSRSRLESFVLGRSQWCVSRQRAWGVPIPALYRKTPERLEAVMTGESIAHIMKVIEQRGIDAWWTDPEDDPAWVLPGLDGTFVRGKDTMDVWFDSGSSWTLLEKRPDQPVADVYLEGSDQHRGWFQSSLLTHIAHQSDAVVPANGSATETKHSTSRPPMHAPFKTLITHGFTLDQDGRKMSKSLGNVISPAQIMNGTLLPPIKPKKKKGQKTTQSSAPTYDALGTDALRLWVGSSDYTKDVVIGQPILQGIHTSLQKYRVTFKWLLGVLRDYDPTSAPPQKPSLLMDRIALYQLSQISQQAHTHYVHHAPYRAVAGLNKYVSHALSAFYFETLKDRLYAGAPSDRLAAQSVLWHILHELLDMLAPVCPVLAEEAWDFARKEITALEGAAPGDAPGRRAWKPFRAAVFEGDEGKEMERKLEVLTAAHSAVKIAQEAARDKKLIGSGLECSVRLIIPPEAPKVAQTLLCTEMEEELAGIFVVSGVQTAVCGKAESAAGETANGQNWGFEQEFDIEGHVARVVVGPANDHKCPRCWRFVAEREDELCKRCDGAVNGTLLET